MLNTMKKKIAAVVAALGLGAGFTFVITKDSCEAKPTAPAPQAGESEAGTAGQ